MGCLAVLIAIGVVAAAFSAGPVLGIVAMVVLLGPLMVGAGRLFFTSSGREFRGAKGQAFITAWEARNGPMRGNHRPSKADAERWLKANDTTGVSAADWLDGVRPTHAQRRPERRPPTGTGSTPQRQPPLSGSGHWTRASFLPDVAEKIPCTFEADPRGMVVHLAGQPHGELVPWTSFTGFKSYGGAAGILLLQGMDTAVIDIGSSDSPDRRRWEEALQAAGVENRTD